MKRPGIRILCWISMIALMAVGGLAPAALADSLAIGHVDRECVVGESLFFVIKIELDEEKEIDVSDATLNGAPLSYQVGESSSSSLTLMVNGKLVRSSSGVEKNYTFEIPTDKVGPLTLPAFKIVVGDKSYQVPELTFRVLARPTSDNLLFKTEIINAQPYYYPTQVIDIRCKIYYRKLAGSPSIDNIHLPFLKERALALIPPENVTFEAPINNERMQIAHETGAETYKGKRYNLFRFRMKFRLMAPGRFEFDSFLKMQVETGRRRTGFFGTLRRDTKALYADAEPLKLHVKSLPEENTPPSFTGAIGDFKIKTIPDRTDVKVGDPVTLSVEISGRGTWEFVKAPPLHKIPEITDYFLVSDEPSAGEVSEDRTRKTFLMRLRVKSKTAREIPPIPFSFFNLVSQEYVTIHSEPTPLKVFDATSRTEIVDYGKKSEEKPEEKPETEPGESTSPGEEGLPIQLPEPEPPALIEIADNVPGDRLLENHAPDYSRAMLAFIPLGIVLALFLFNLYRGRDVSGEKLRQEKTRNAYKTFLNNISPLDKRNPDASTFYRDLGNGIHEFLRDRFASPMEEIDGSFVNRLAESGKVTREVTNEITDIMESVDLHRYSADSFHPTEASELLKKTKKVLKQC